MARDEVSPLTKEEEEREAEARHDPDRPPTADEEAAIEEEESVPEEVRRSIQDMNERGVRQQGEGRIAGVRPQ
jgi:hypothetical protein